MMLMSAQQRTLINTELSYAYGRLYLNCDGYALSVQVKQSKMKLVIAVFVNGSIKGIDAWQGLESELDQMGLIARKFWCLKRKALYTAKQIAGYEKGFGKKRAKELGVYRRFCYARPYFATPSAFITHIKKHCQSIELIDHDAYDALIEALPKEADHG